MPLDFGLLFSAYFTVASTIFVAELTDKDALLLLALATKMKPRIIFAAGSLAFTLTTAIIVTVGYFLVQFFPVFWIKLVGGVVMIVYAIWEAFFETSRTEENEKEKILGGVKKERSGASLFLGIVTMLMLLDLAGDATEVLTVVYIAHFRNAILVFLGCITGLVAASAVDTALGNRLGKMVSVEKIKIVSVVVFLVIGIFVIVTTLDSSIV